MASPKTITREEFQLLYNRESRRASGTGMYLSPREWPEYMEALKAAANGNPARITDSERFSAETTRKIYEYQQKAQAPGALRNLDDFLRQAEPVSPSILVGNGNKGQIEFENVNISFEISPFRLEKNGWRKADLSVSIKGQVLPQELPVVYIDTFDFPLGYDVRELNREIDYQSKMTIEVRYKGQVKRVIVYENIAALESHRGAVNAYDRFYFNIVSKVDKSSKETWLEKYDAVTGFIGGIKAEVEADAGLVKRYAPAVHNNGYYRQQEESIGSKTNPLIGAHIREDDSFLKDHLTEEGYARYTKRYESGPKGWKFNVDIVRENMRVSFFMTTKGMSQAEATKLSAMPDIEKKPLLNANIMSWNGLVRDADNYPDREARLKVMNNNQIGGIASALALTRMSVQLTPRQIEEATHNVWTYVGQWDGKDGYEKNPLVSTPFNKLPLEERSKDLPIFEAVVTLVRTEARQENAPIGIVTPEKHSESVESKAAQPSRKTSKLIHTDKAVEEKKERKDADAGKDRPHVVK